MDQIESMKAFVAVAEQGGFAGAGRVLCCATATITRQVAALESHLGARLLHRTTRSVRLTEVGQRYLQDCRQVLQALDEADALARGAHVEPQGELKVTAPVVFGRLHVLPVMLSYLQAHPRVTVQTQFVDHVVHLIDEGVDVALRIQHLPDSSLVALPVGQLRRVLVASPDYLARRGTPRNPDDLARHDLIGLDRPGRPFQPWCFRDPASSRPGLKAIEMPPVRLKVNHNEVALDAALTGHGLALALSYQVASRVVSGELRILLPEWEPAPIPVHLVHAEGRRAAAKVRTFLDHAVPLLKARLQGLANL